VLALVWFRITFSTKGLGFGDVLITAVDAFSPGFFSFSELEAKKWCAQLVLFAFWAQKFMISAAKRE